MRIVYFNKNYLLAFALTFAILSPTQAQLLKKLKEKVEATTSSESSASESETNTKKGTKEISLDYINANFTEDDYGFSGLYYYQDELGVFPAKFDFSICENKSKIKGAEDVPACILVDFSIAYQEDRNSDPRTNNSSIENDYGYAYNVMHNNLFTVSGGRSGLSALFQLAPGVVLMTPNNTKTHFFNKDAYVNKYDDEDWDYLLSKSTVFVKNKEDLKNWSSLNKEFVKAKVLQQSQNLQNVYAELEAKKHEANEMPSIGSLNSNALQERGLTTYNKKYSKINAGWKHEYMYIHSDEWFYKKKLNIFGQEVESHREIHAVIVRVSPNGECRADLMFYVEPYESGKYHEDRGFIAGPVSYQGMPGGILNCKKANDFKAKAIQ